MTKTDLKVVKIGGKLIDDEQRLKRFLSSFSALKGHKILVHGGGSLATEMSRSLGIEPRMADGRRITSDEDIRVVTMVYAGWINKTIVAGLQARGCRALGLSGADGGVIRAGKRAVKKVDFGWVGDVEEVDTGFVQLLLNQEITPVFCAITHNGRGQLLNTNADTVAAEIAVAMSRHFSTQLLYCFEKKGVLRHVEDERSVIRELDYPSYRSGVAEGAIHKGMLPKLHTGFDALERGVSEVFVGDESLLNNDRKLFTRLMKG